MIFNQLFSTDSFSQWLQGHYIELFGVISGLLYIYLEIKQKSSMWLVGLVTSASYVYIFYQSKFYADMLLNIYYVAISGYGWYSWRFAKKRDGEISERNISRIEPLPAVVLLLISAALFGIMGYFLSRFTDSPVPYYDALTTALSIIATWLLARKILEHWLCWIFINFFSAALYLWRDLYPTAVLFAIYGILSIVGWVKWRQSYKNQ